MKASVYPYGLCELPVTWNCQRVCCDDCSIWYHKSCMELCTQDYELLDRSNVQWLCCKCESINVSPFTSYELKLRNIYEPISDLNITLESIPSVFSTLKSSSPNSYTGNSTRSRSTRNSPRSYLSSNPYDTSEEKHVHHDSQLPQY
jgi:hypothetical protein